MTINRRSFLKGLAGSLIAAPAIVRADSLMKLWVPKQEIVISQWTTVALDQYGKIPTNLLPAFINDVVEFSDKENFPQHGKNNIIYMDISKQLSYRSTDEGYIPIHAYSSTWSQ